MTREEAIQYLESWLEEEITAGFDEDTYRIKSLCMAIKALENPKCRINGTPFDECGWCEHFNCETCKCEARHSDLISREDAVRWVKIECNPYGKPTLDFESGKKVIEHLKQMPSAPSADRPTDEEDILKFYYVESIDDYWIGRRLDNFYYADWHDGIGFVWSKSRYLPWGEHIVDDKTLWKEHTYPSEPKEMPFTEWIVGFVKKYFADSPMGEWIYHVDDLFPAESTQECSICHAEQPLNINDENYCPSCGAYMGAKMKGGNE